ncbi:MAG: TVP38/TMEM64 family protein [Coriobacteriia bacterium]|nr:TVP38/TMEM64 family protein [Coriobacteriia bacterium]
MDAQRGDETQERDRGQTRKVWLIPLAVIAVLVVLYFVWPPFHSFVSEAYGVLSSGEQQRIESWVNGYGAWSFVVLIALMLLQTIVAFLPSVVIMAVAVVSFGPVVGGLLTWGGLVLAASLGYGIGRSFGVATVDRLVGSKTEQKMEHVLDRYGVWAVVAARLSPVLSTDAVSIAAGLVGMKFVPFIAATAAGTLPLTVFVAWLGADMDRLQAGLIWISVASIAFFVAYVVYDRYFRSE